MRAVAVGKNKAVIRSGKVGNVGGNIKLFSRCELPHTAKHCKKAFYRLAAEHDSAVKPVTEAYHFINVLVAYVEAARKRRFAVYDHNFAVVAVVHENIH